MSKGIELRLYKNNAPVSGVINKFDIQAFMHFDGIEAIADRHFNEFGGASSSFSNEERFAFERRRLNLYTLDDSLTASEILDPNNAKYIKYPIMLISLIEFVDCGDTEKNTVTSQLDDYKDSYDSIRFGVFGSLGLADLVTVIRASNFSDAYDALAKVYDSESSSKGFKSIYSIPAICTNNESLSNWNEQPGSLAMSIRLALRQPSSSIVNEISELLEDSGIFDGTITTHLTFGKFDVDYTGKIGNVSRFATFFFGCNGNSNNQFSETSEFYQKHIIQRNTRLMKIMDINAEGIAIQVNIAAIEVEAEEVIEPPETTNVSDDEDIIQTLDIYMQVFCDDVVNIEENNRQIQEDNLRYLSDTERSTLIHIFARIGYISRSAYFRHKAKYTNLLVEILYHAARGTVTKRRINEDTSSELTDCFRFAYTYIENLILTARRDFETQDKFNLSYAESSKLLEAYVNFSKKVVNLLQVARKKVRDEDNTHHLFLPMVGFTHQVRLRVLTLTTKENADSRRFGFFLLPLGQIHDIPDIIAFILHEVGHKLRVDRALRNKEFIEKFFPLILDYTLENGVRTILRDARIDASKSATIIDETMKSIFKNEYVKRPSGKGYITPKALWERICTQRDSCHAYKCSCMCNCNVEFSDFVKCIGLWIKAYLPRIAESSMLRSYVSSNPSIITSIAELTSSIENSVSEFANVVWGEAFADIFMVAVLNLSSIDYKDIMHRFLVNTRGRLDANYFIRICAVCMYIEKPASETERKNVMNSVTSHELWNIRKFAKNANNIDADLMCLDGSLSAYSEVLYESMNTLLSDNYESILGIESISDEIERIREIYESCRGVDSSDVERFKSAVNFIEFCK